MPERLPMQRRTAGTRARVLAMVVASALGPVGAAEAAGPVTVKAKLAGQDATSTAIFVRASIPR